MEGYKEDGQGGCSGDQHLHGAGVASSEGGGVLSEGRSWAEEWLIKAICGKLSLLMGRDALLLKQMPLKANRICFITKTKRSDLVFHDEN